MKKKTLTERADEMELKVDQCIGDDAALAGELIKAYERIGILEQNVEQLVGLVAKILEEK